MNLNGNSNIKQDICNGTSCPSPSMNPSPVIMNGNSTVPIEDKSGVPLSTNVDTEPLPEPSEATKSGEPLGSRTTTTQVMTGMSEESLLIAGGLGLLLLLLIMK